MKKRLSEIAELTSTRVETPKVVCVEWIEPLMAAGNWVPDLVKIAGGRDLLGIPNAHTPKIELSKLLGPDPDKIIVMPCGWDIEKNRSEMDQSLQSPKWQSLRAVQNGELYLTDGNQFFNRPGPRIVESAEILAEIFHPDLADFGHQNTGWGKY